MAKACYVGVENVARKAKSLYIGVGGVARKVKKAYVGVNGVARLFYASEKKIIKGTAPDLAKGRGYLAAASNGSFALFGGGNEAYVEAYAPNLVRWIQEGLTKTGVYLGAARAGNYALFGGGQNPSGSGYSNSVDAYSNVLVKTALGAVLPSSSTFEATVGASVAGYAIFSSNSTAVAFSPTLTKVSVASLRTPIVMRLARGTTGTAELGDYALFGGGYVITSTNPTVQGQTTGTVTAYNSSLVQSAPADLYSGHPDRGAATSEHAVFAGSNKATAYSTALTRSAVDALSVQRSYSAATAAGGYIFFGGGYPSDGAVAVVDAYDESLVRSTQEDLSVAVLFLAGVSIGDYALFGGGMLGWNSTSFTATVNAYKVE